MPNWASSQAQTKACKAGFKEELIVQKAILELERECSAGGRGSQKAPKNKF